MEAVPRLPMISCDMKVSPNNTDFGPVLKKFIREYYQEDPESYAKEIKEIETLRQNAIKPPMDYTGCSLLKRYYSQLHKLQCHFPMTDEGLACVPFMWTDLYSGVAYNITDLEYEQACILYNIGAIHSKLATLDSRSNAEGMKIACTHFQCSAWAFQHLRETYPQPKGSDMSHDLLTFFINIMLAQAQECILEKSMLDSRKSSITAKIAAQVVDYYKCALGILVAGSPSSDAGCVHVVGSKTYKGWKRFIQFKMSYYYSVSHLYMGNQAEENEKWGERVAWYQSAYDHLNEAFKSAKHLDREELNESLTFTMDVIGGKRSSSKKENEFVYHDKVPAISSLPELKGASLVKGIPFSITDTDVSGPDIFARLVPMEAHETASLYSEEKAKLLRTVTSNISTKNEELVAYLSSLQLEAVPTFEDEEKIPQELLEKCAAMSVKAGAVFDLQQMIYDLLSTSKDVENNLMQIASHLAEEETKEKEHQELFGKRGPSLITVELRKEFSKYEEAHKIALESNNTLDAAINIHINNLSKLLLPLEELAEMIPSCKSIKTPENLKSMERFKQMVEKVDEMKKQRETLEQDLRNSLMEDDITKSLVTNKETDMNKIFSQELQKHQETVMYLEKNCLAQDNILCALTEANAQFADTRKAILDIKRQRDEMVKSLINSYEAYDDLVLKVKKGAEFYQKLLSNVVRLLTRVRSVTKVQDEERSQIASVDLRKASRVPKIANLPPETHVPKLKDYLPFMTKQGGTVTVPSGIFNSYGVPHSSSNQGTVLPPEPGRQSSPMSAVLPPSNNGMQPSDKPETHAMGIRPAPVGSEQTSIDAACSFIATTTHVPYHSYPASQPWVRPAVSDSSASFRHPNASEQQINNSYSSNSSLYGQPTSHGTPSGFNSLSSGGISIPQTIDTTRMPLLGRQQPSPALSNIPKGSIIPPEGYQSQYSQLPNPTESNYSPNPPAAQSTIPASIKSSSLYPYGMQPPVQTNTYSTPVQTNTYSTPVQTNTYSTPVQPNPYGASVKSTVYATHGQPNSSSATAYYSSVISGVPYTTVRNLVPNSPNALHTSGFGTGNLPSTTVAPSAHMPTSFPTTSNSNSNMSQYTNKQQPGVLPSPPHMQYYPTVSQTSFSVVSCAAVNQVPSANSLYTNATVTTHPSQPVSNAYTNYSGGSPNFFSQSYPQAQNCVNISGQPSNASNAGIPPNNANFNTTSYTTMQNNVLSSNQNTCQTYSQIPQMIPQSLPSQTITPTMSPASQPLYSGTMNNVSSAMPQNMYYGAPQIRPQMVYTSVPSNIIQSNNQPTFPGAVCNVPSQTPYPSVTSASQQNNVSQITNQYPTPQNYQPTTNLPGQYHPSSSVLPHPIQPELQPVVSPQRFPPSSPIIQQNGQFQNQGQSVTAVVRNESPSLNVIRDLITPPLEDTTSKLAEKESEPQVLQPKVIDLKSIAQAKEKDPIKDPLDDPSVRSKFVSEVEKYEKLVDGLVRKSLNGTTPLDQKWKELIDAQDKESRKMSISVARCCPLKNRYPDVMPYDNNRVKLQSSKDDYINASYLKDICLSSPVFVLTQAPLPATYSDFWLMVWEQQVETLVCLLPDFELKNHVYFPKDRGTVLPFGIFEVSLHSYKEKNGFTERMINLTHTKNRTSRVVVHLQFIQWPVSGIPSSPAPILQFISDVLSYQKQQRSLLRPVVVHCSAGIGRSGCFCLITALVNEMNSGIGPRDATQVATLISQQRKFLIQEKEQLKFCYDCLLYYAQDLLMRRGILTTRASFDNKLPGSGNTSSHVRHPSEDFILGSGGLAKLQSGMEKMGLAPPSDATSAPEATLTPPDAISTSPEAVSATTETTPISSAASAQLEATSTPPEANSMAVDTNNACSKVIECGDAPATNIDEQLSNEDLPPEKTLQSITSLLDPLNFTLDGMASPSKRKITKENFSTSRGSLCASSTDSADPLSQLDPLWSLKK